MMRIEKFTILYRDVTKEGTKIPQEKYCLTGQFPIVDQGQRIIAGWWNDDDGIFKDVPAIIFGDHTRAIKYMEEPFFIGADGVKILRPTNVRDNPKYLYYALQAAKIPKLGYSRHFKVVKELEIRMYSRDEQDEIVRVLEKIDYLIEQRHAETTYLDQLVKSRFIELFGDPKQNPKGYPVKEFDEISVLITDGEHATPRRTDKGIYLLSARNILNHALQLDDVNYIDEEEYTRIARRVVPQAGDVLISCSGSIGRCCVVPEELRFQMVRSAALIRFDDTINPVFAEWLITSDELQRQISMSATQSSQANLFQGKIRKLRGYVPPMELQEQFAAFVEQTDKSKFYIVQMQILLRLLIRAIQQKTTEVLL